MSFTIVGCTRDYDLADGTDPTGTVTFTPTAPMVNGPTVVAAPVTAKLDVDGLLTINLAANDDSGTLPTGVSYLVQESIAGVTRTYYMVIPHAAAPTVDLSSLDSHDSIVLPDAVTLASLLALKADVTALALKADLTALAAYQTITTRLTRLITAPVTVTYAASVTLDASLGCVHRVTATGDLSLADVINGIDGQRVTFEVLASGAARTVTAAGNATAVPAGTWWAADLIYHSSGDLWVLC